VLKTTIAIIVTSVVVAVIIGAVLLHILNSNVPPENGGDNGHSDENSFLFSFEDSMEGWEAKTLDLELGNSTIDWSITRSQENAKNGSSSLRLYLANWNDMGKIWIERSFAVKPNTQYRVNISYAFASADWGAANFFKIITGVLQKQATSRDQLMYQGDTGNGAQSNVGYIWMEKNYSFPVESDVTGKLFVTVGVWGVWETPRTYYLDDLKVVITELAV
jgi:hypothetical protein